MSDSGCDFDPQNVVDVQRWLAELDNLKATVLDDEDGLRGESKGPLGALVDQDASTTLPRTIEPHMDYLLYSGAGGPRVDAIDSRGRVIRGVRPISHRCPFWRPRLAGGYPKPPKWSRPHTHQP